MFFRIFMALCCALYISRKIIHFAPDQHTLRWEDARKRNGKVNRKQRDNPNVKESYTHIHRAGGHTQKELNKKKAQQKLEMDKWAWVFVCLCVKSIYFDEML